MDGLFYLGVLMGFWSIAGKVIGMLGKGGKKKEATPVPELRGTKPIGDDEIRRSGFSSKGGR